MISGYVILHYGVNCATGAVLYSGGNLCEITGKSSFLLRAREDPYTRGTYEPGTVNVEIAPNNAASIASALDGLGPDGATPTRISLEAAREQLASIVVGPDEPTRPKYVLLVTDGAPNCEDGAGAARPDTSHRQALLPDFAAVFQCIADVTAMAANAVDQAAVDGTVGAITDQVGDGVKTYVIGFSTKNVPNPAAALDPMANAGDTGDTAHRAVEDEAGLVTEFEEIAGVAVSCEFVLDEAPEDPSYVQVTLDDEQLNLNEPDGWIISEDRKKVTVQGKACQAIQDGTKQKLLVKVLCEVVVPE